MRTWGLGKQGPGRPKFSQQALTSGGKWACACCKWGGRGLSRNKVGQETRCPGIATAAASVADSALRGRASRHIWPGSAPRYLTQWRLGCKFRGWDMRLIIRRSSSAMRLALSALRRDERWPASTGDKTPWSNSDFTPLSRKDILSRLFGREEEPASAFVFRRRGTPALTLLGGTEHGGAGQ